MEDLKCSYKYTVAMPPQLSSISEFKDKLFKKHSTAIIQGKAQLLISPIYRREESIFIQPIFDFDGRRGGGILKAYTEAKDMKQKLEKYPSYFEVTPDGLHLVLLIAIYGIDVERYREEVKRSFSYSTLDVSASCRDVPIFRLGSYKDGQTIIPVVELNTVSIQKMKNRIPSEIYAKQKWHTLWSQYLFPTNTVSGFGFLKTIQS
jgi:hypothetical protein